MIKFKIFAATIFVLCLFARVSPAPAQSAVAPETSFQTDVSDEQQAVEKKKKNDIEINEKFWYGLLIDVASMLLLILLVYYPNNKRYESIFTFVMFNLMIFMLTFVLNKIKLSMGAAFGLFAVFSMLRYRTQGISMKDMTYLFLFVGIGLISAIRLEYYELIIICSIIIAFTFLLDCRWLIRHESSKQIRYENIELINENRSEELIADLKKRTGLEVHRFEVEKIDFLKDAARLTIYYYKKK
ncbi:MAG TPA: DUF4956 domain-containing protein [Bacteroidales bacterium]|nr:DUF4956 domain-containing protein [Bacteroidales bacterium]